MRIRTQSFTIAGSLPGLNEIVRADRGNRYGGNKLKRESDLKVWATAIRRVKPVYGRCSVHIRWIEKDARRDPDNIAAGTKFILDGLRLAGVLAGDGHRHIGPDIHHTFPPPDRDDPRIEVTLLEVIS